MPCPPALPEGQPWTACFPLLAPFVNRGGRRASAGGLALLRNPADNSSRNGSQRGRN